jgi:hypothetical protein
MIGRAADGSVLSSSGNLFEKYIYVHWPLAKGQGYLNGSLTVDGATLSPVRHPVSGSFQWKGAASPLYPSGYYQDLTAEGSQYVAVVDKNLPPFGSSAVAGVKLSISGASLAAPNGPSSQLSFNAKGLGVVASGALNGLKVSVNRAAGTFSGSFIPFFGAKATVFQGVLNTPTTGYGYTLIREGFLIRPSTVKLEFVP